MSHPARLDAGTPGDGRDERLASVRTAMAACEAAWEELNQAAPGDLLPAEMYARCTRVLRELAVQLDATAGQLRQGAAADAVVRLLDAGVPQPRRGLHVVPGPH